MTTVYADIFADPGNGERIVGNCDPDEWTLRNTSKSQGCFTAAPGKNNKTWPVAGQNFGSNPCPGANSRSFSKANFYDPNGQYACQYDVSDENLQIYSQDYAMTTAGMGTESLYKQLVFGSTKGPRPTPGFCQDFNNLSKVVNGKTMQTCNDLAGTREMQIKYCNKNPTDPACKCLNAAQGVPFCQKNPTVPGCVEVLAGLQAYQASGVGIPGDFVCLAPYACTDPASYNKDEYSARVCSLNIAVCNQASKIDDTKIAGAAALKQECNIQQSVSSQTNINQDLRTPGLSNQTTPDAIPDSTTPPPASPPASPPAADAPPKPTGLTRNQKIGIGVGVGVGGFLLLVGFLIFLYFMTRKPAAST